MSNYRAIIHYHVKQGMEEKAVLFFEKELIKKAQDYGCHYIELLQNEKDHSILVGIATWNSLADAKRFQSLWESKEKEFLKLCTGIPRREFFKLRTSYLEKYRKSA